MTPLVLAILLLFPLATLSSAQDAPRGTTGSSAPPMIVTSLIDAETRGVGEARLQQTPHGVLIRLQLKNVTPGVHGVHIHEIGRCDAPSFESAGGHFTSSGREHGFLNPRGPHDGDLPNIEVPASTELTVEYFLPGLRLDPGPRSLLDSNGSALVIHAGPDDYRSDPAGEAGARLACGRIAQPQ